MAKAPSDKDFHIPRDGARDIAFKGRLIGEGDSGHDHAEIYRTAGGKFVASLVRRDAYSTENDKCFGTSADTAQEVAAFYTLSSTTGTGKNRETRSLLNEAGKIAMREAASHERSFLEQSDELVD